MGRILDNMPPCRMGRIGTALEQLVQALQEELASLERRLSFLETENARVLAALEAAGVNIRRAQDVHSSVFKFWHLRKARRTRIHYLQCAQNRIESVRQQNHKRV